MSLAEERIEILFEKAEERSSNGRKDLADRYVELAGKVGMKAEEPIPDRFRFKYCEECGSFLEIGEDSRKRINSEKEVIVFTCLKCGNIQRYPLND